MSARGACTGGAGASIRSADGQLGSRCLRLDDDSHGSWYIQLELPADLDGSRRRIRRAATRRGDTAEAVLVSLRVPAPGDPGAGILTVGDWLVSRSSPAASTLRSYTAHVRPYLALHLGPVLLAELSTAHLQAMFTAIIRRHQALGTPISAATQITVAVLPAWIMPAWIFWRATMSPPREETRRCT